MTQAMHQVLVIEDDAAIRDVLRVLLQTVHYRVIEAGTAERGEIEARSHKPDLLLVDLGLPDDDGLKVIARVRAWSPVPIVVLSARQHGEDKVEALDLGADDYVTKPFAMNELMARLRAAVRRGQEAAPAAAVVEVGDLAIDLARKRVTRSGQDIRLTPTEWGFLELLARNLGKLVPRAQILREVWGPGYEKETHYLRVYAAQLRRKLEDDPGRPRHLLTSSGLGYTLEP